MSDINEVQKIAVPAPQVKTAPKAEPAAPVVLTASAELKAMQEQMAAADLEVARLRLAQALAEVEDLKKRAELRDLELRERQLNLVDLQERLDDRQLKKRSRESVYRGHGQNLKQDAINRQTRHDICNHHKGGDGAQGVIGGQGDDTQFCVARHVMPSGDTWQRCLRCGKTWRPPVLSEYNTAAEYKAAMAEYNEALKMPTRNKRSSSHTFQWGVVMNERGVQEGGIEHFREKMKHVTLD
jgi:hypothetical protein